MINSLRNLFFRDFLLKLFSLVMAVLIWLVVRFAIQKEGSPLPTLPLAAHELTFANLPVLVMSSAQDVHEVKVQPSTVEVTVQGDAKVLGSIQSKDIRPIVDLTGVVEAAGDLRKRIEVTTPPGVALTHIVPEDVKVIFPRKD